jgi:hypothetical protein
MMSSESLPAFEPGGRASVGTASPSSARRLPRTPTQQPEVHQSPESQTGIPPIAPSPARRSSAGVRVAMERGCAYSPIRSSTEGAPGGGSFQPAAAISPRVTLRVTSPGSLVPGGW